jgi:WD40 repeat protein
MSVRAMADDDTADPRVEQLLEQVLNSGETPEEVCRSCPQLLPQVRAGLRQLRQLEEQVSGLFPPSRDDAGKDGEPASVVPPELPLVPGYDVEGILGHGGMGIVYRAVDLRLNRPVALKMVLGGSFALPAQRQRFLREAESIAAISHPNIVQVHNAGETDGRPWFTMELVAGGSLSQKINGTPQPVRRSAELVASIARAIAVAHARGIVHRDLKPGNILMSADGTPKVTDFGLARWTDQGAGTTLTGSPLGTPSYMAPEQARGASGDIGAATDVYALGAVLYELLTGRAPFKAESSTATIQQVLTIEPAPPARLNPRVPRDLETICLKCLNKERSRRYTTAAELADDLERFLRYEPIRARRVGLVGHAWRWAERHPGLAVMTGALIITALLSVALIVRQWRVAEHARADATRMATRLVLDRGITQCERGDVASGLLWFAQGLEQAERSGEKELIPALRANLDAWSKRLVVPRVSPALGSHLTVVAFHPLGKGLLVARGANPFQQTGPAAVLLVDRETWQPLGAALEHPLMFRAAVFSPDGTRVLTAGADGAVQLWDASTGRPLATSLQLPLTVTGLAFSPDGQRFATATVTSASTGEGRIWETSTGRALTPVLPTRGRATSVAFSPDGMVLATASSLLRTAHEPESGEVQFWESHTGQLLSARRFSSPVGVVAFNPDGRTVAAGSSDGLVLRWRFATGESISPPLRHLSPVRDIVFSRDGRSMFTAAALQMRPKEQECAVRLWDLDSGRLLAGPWMHPEDIWAISLSRDGHSLASACEDGHVRIFAVGAWQPKVWHYLDDVLASERFSPDGLMRVTGSSGIARFSANGHHLLASASAPDGQETSRLVDVLTGESHQLLSEPNSVHAVGAATLPASPSISRSRIEGLAFGPGDTTAVTTDGGDNVCIWDVESARLIQGPRSYGEKTIPWMRMMPDDHTLVSGARGHPIEVWDRDTGKRLAGPIVGDGNVQTMTLSPDGRTLATAGDGGIIQLWDMGTGRVLSRFDAVGQTIWTLRFSQDGRTLLAGGTGTAWLFDTSIGKQRCRSLPQPGTVWEAQFSRRGDRVLTVCSDNYRDQNPGTAQLWDARKGTPVGPALPHRVAELAAAFDPQGRLVATGGYDGDVRFWDAATGTPVGPALVQSGPIPAIAFVAGTNLLAAAGKDGNLALWPVPEARTGDPADIRRWVQSLTGQELDESTR